MENKKIPTTDEDFCKKHFPFNELKNYTNYHQHFFFQNRNDANLNYTDSYKLKYSCFDETSDWIVAILTEFLAVYENPEIYLGMEGYSYQSDSNNLIDTVEANTLLKCKLMKAFLNSDVKKLAILSPKEIKMKVGKGSYNKVDMFDKFLEKKTGIWLDTFCSENKERIKIQKKTKIEIITPVDDLIDAWWITYFLTESLNKNLDV